MQWLQRLASKMRRRSRARHSANKPRSRRALLEQFEHRLVLAVAYDDSYTAHTNQPLVVEMPGPLSNDGYSDCDPTPEELCDRPEAAVISGPSHGSITWQSGGGSYFGANPPGLSFTYVAAAGFTGEDQFTYSLIDDASYDTAVVTITVSNAAPAVSDAGYVVALGSVLTGQVAASDADGDTVTLALSGGGPYHGDATLNPDGSFVYTPNPSYVGADSFVYSASDGVATSTATVTIDVIPPPATTWDRYTVAQNSSLSVNAPGVLSNDSGAGPLTASLATDVGHGTLVLHPNGGFEYTPTAGYSGWDVFYYQAHDGPAVSGSTAVWIEVDAPPVAADDSVTIASAYYSTAYGGVLINDSDPEHDALTATVVTQPTHGQFGLNWDGSFVYTPVTGYVGADSFTYQASDGYSTSSVATMTINVIAVTSALDASDDAFTAAADLTLSVAAPGVLEDDTAPSGSTLTALLVDRPAHGQVTLNPDGSFVYAAAAGFVGGDTFTYRPTDGSSAGNLATVALQVAAAQDVAITSFYSDGTDLKIEYLVLGQSVAPFTITVYASSDRTSLDQALEIHDGDNTQGRHTLTIHPTFDDPQEDYYLVAQVDSDNDVAEVNEDNNAAPFLGGAFIVHEASSGKTVLHAQGTDRDEAIHIESLYSERQFWSVWMPQREVAMPNLSVGYYDVTGDNVVTRLDADAIDNYYSGLSGGWQNTTDRFDVNRDGFESPADALAVINDLNARGAHVLTGHPQSNDLLVDITGDIVVSSLDAAQILDKLNGGSGDINPPGRNPLNPFEVDGFPNGSDAGLILNFLSFGYTGLPGPLTLDEVHIRSHGGADVVTVSDAVAWIFGGAGDDFIGSVGRFDSFLDGGDGNDTIYGNNGDDTIVGGAGDDYVSGGNGADTIDGGGGNDALYGGAGDDSLSGGDGSDTLTGGSGDDALYGGSGTNSLDGGGGYDIIQANGPYPDSDFSNHYIRVFLDMHRIADAVYDERNVVVTLTGPDGLSMSELRSTLPTAGITGDTDPSVVFPLFDAYTEYTVTVTPSAGLTIPGNTPFNFNSSDLTYGADGAYEKPFLVLSQFYNYDADGNPPYPDYVPPYIPEPFVGAINHWGPGDQNSRYVVLSGGTLIEDAASGLLPGDSDGNNDPLSMFHAQKAADPQHGSVVVNDDGSFTYTANAGIYGLDFFRYWAIVGGVKSLMATVFVADERLAVQARALDSWGWTTISGVRRLSPPQAWVGQAINLRVAAQGPPVANPFGENPQYTWDLAGKVVSGYEISYVDRNSATSAKVKAFNGAPTHEATPTVYWVDGGIKDVLVSVVISKRFPVGATEQISALGSIALKRPQLTTFNSSTDDIRKIPGTGTLKIQYGQGQNPGTLFIAGPVSNVGTFVWAQLLDADRYFGELVGDDGRPDVNGTLVSERLRTPEFVLDTVFPKGSGTFVGNDGLTYTYTNDYPSVTLQNPAATDRSTTNHTDYKTYLLWKPNTPGSILVPLKVALWTVEWGVEWQGTATGWNLYNKYHSPVAIVDTNKHPEWNYNITQFPFVRQE